MVVVGVVVVAFVVVVVVGDWVDVVVGLSAFANGFIGLGNHHPQHGVASGTGIAIPKATVNNAITTSEQSTILIILIAYFDLLY